MKKNAVTLTLVLFTALFALACGGDDSPSSNNADNQSNLNNENNQNNLNNVNNLNNLNNENNQNNENNLNNVNNEEPDMGQDMTSEEDMGMDMAEEDMGPDEVSITWPATPEDFADSANANTYISELITPEILDNEPTCCKDFGDISKNEGIDNALAELDEAIAGFGASLAGSLQNGINQGSVVILLDHRELSGADDADGFVLSWLNGAFADGTSYANASSGQGQFLLAADSFDAGTGEPQIVFNPAQMVLGEMSAGPAPVSLLLPLDDAFLSVTVQNAEVTGTATLSLDGVAYTAGTISGYIEVENLIDALNELAASSCGCLGLQQPLFEEVDGEYVGNCVDNVAAACPNQDEEICRVIGGNVALPNGEFCGVLPNLFEGSADISTNGDPDTYEALSLGLEWVGVNAEVTGIAN